VHLKAHPIFQSAFVIVKAGLVQLPWDWVGPRSTRAGVAAAVDDVSVDPPTAVVVELLEFAAAVVVVVVELPELAAAAVVVELDPAGGGGLYAPVLGERVDECEPPFTA